MKLRLLLLVAVAASGLVGGAGAAERAIYPPPPSWIGFACAGTACTMKVDNPAGSGRIYSWVSVGVGIGLRISNPRMTPAAEGQCNRAIFAVRSHEMWCFTAVKAALCAGCAPLGQTFDLAPGQEWKSDFDPGESWSFAFDLDQPLPAGREVVICMLRSQTILFDEAECYSAVSRAQTTIDSLSVDYRGIVAREGASLKSTIFSLGDEKSALEESLPKLHARAAAGLRNDARLSAAVRDVEAQFAVVARALGQLDAARGEAPPAARALLRNRVRIADRLAGLKDNARTAAVAARISADEKALAAIDAEIDSRLEGTPLADVQAAWARSFRTLHAALERLRSQQRASSKEKVAAEAALREAIARQSEIDRRLVEIAEHLRFDVREVTVEAEGAVVFRAVAKSPLPALDALDARIDDAAQGMDALDAERAAIRKGYFAAAEGASEKHKRVAAILARQVYDRAVIDYGFHIYDLVSAGAKGGLVGVGVEASRKVIEVLVFEYLVPRKGGPVADDVEAEVNREYQAGLRDSLSKHELSRTAGERMLKESVGKVYRDTLNSKLGPEVFDKVGYRWRYRYVTAAPKLDSHQLGELTRVRDKLRDMRKKLVDLRSGPKINLRSLAGSIFRDSLKAGLRAALKLEEKNAWVEYLELDMLARSYYPLFGIASRRYWAARDYHDALLAEKLAKLGGGDSAFETRVSKPFAAGAKLTIALTMASRSPTTPVTVLVGDARASGPTTVFTLDSPTYTGTSKTFALEVR